MKKHRPQPLQMTYYPYHPQITKQAYYPYLMYQAQHQRQRQHAPTDHERLDEHEQRLNMFEQRLQNLERQTYMHHYADVDIYQNGYSFHGHRYYW
ncbi:hypothetical protein [Alicyclobacillus fodiniaquatilis]|uniref:Uncharacterized protein n=1 Tax=Alicyclobacillus fodiniaquatilis TaxID=1661150 RepID=A0ABW4JQI2_9BACL